MKTDTQTHCVRDNEEWWECGKWKDKSLIGEAQALLGSRSLESCESAELLLPDPIYVNSLDF